MRRTRLIVGSVLAALIGTMSCMHATASAEGAVAPNLSAPPKLLVFITVDQLRGDMLGRYASDLKHGYRRLMEGGAWFTNAFQDHAITETAPGHASTMSGRFPRSTGIVSNTEGVNTREFPLLVGLPSELGASPERFHGTTVFDWLQKKHPRARALSVSRKDRGAILPIGRSKQDIYWYSPVGSFTTSTYYKEVLPDWVKAFNDRHILQKYAGAAWTLTRDAATYTEPDSVPFEHGGRDFMFPHQFPSDSLQVASYVMATPTIDSMTALFALEGLQQTGIGRGPQTDILAVSFSGTDYVGHTYGPDSREAHENEMRLDETIGWFIDSLFKLRDPSTVVFALTGDHGASPIPELARARGQATGDEGLRVNVREAIHAVRQGLADAHVDSMAFIAEAPLFGVDRAALTAARLNADSVIGAFAKAVRQVQGVARADLIANLRKADPATDFVARRYAHQIPEGYPLELAVTLTRYSYWGNSFITSTHGSPYDQDAHVPIIFYGPWVKPGRYTTFARTVDIAPTLAQILGVKPSEKLDGLVLLHALK
jgi:predicted AlkP superfamily pyrophosphatase or phosphodiesterase